MRKLILRTLVISVLLLSLFTVTAFADNATVTGNGVNFRSGPGMNYSVIACLDRGTQVTVADRSNGTWYNVIYNGQSGFMSSSYLSLETAQPAPDSSVQGNQGYVNAMYVRMRSGPSTGSSILGEYNTGKALTITGSADGWTAVVVDGQAGYIYSSYVSTGSYSGAPAVSGGSNASDDSSDYVIFGGGSAPAVTPAPTQAPVVTEAPEVTEAPAVTETPAVTQTPVPTEAPVVTQTPAPSETPAASEAPVITPTETAAGYINGDYVRFRTGPSTASSIINNYNRGKQLTVTGTSGDWTAAIIDGREGFVYSQYVTLTSTGGNSSGTENKGEADTDGSITTEPDSSVTVSPVAPTEGYVKGNNVRMRSGPSLSADIIGEYFYGNKLTITGTSGDWTAVTVNGKSGYIYSQYVAQGALSLPGSDSVISGGNSELGAQIAQYACQFVGHRYIWGGTSPDGFDCSGLVYYTYQQFGYTLNRIAADQALNGVHVDADRLQPGDILCFYSGGSYIGHVGIYIGDGKFVHAANSATGVVITELSGYYNTRGFEARRIV